MPRFDAIKSPLTWRRIIANRRKQLKREVAWVKGERTTEPKPYEPATR